MSTLKALAIFTVIYITLQLLAGLYFIYMFTNNFSQVLKLFVDLM